MNQPTLNSIIQNPPTQQVETLQEYLKKHSRPQYEKIADVASKMSPPRYPTLQPH